MVSQYRSEKVLKKTIGFTVTVRKNVKKPLVFLCFLRSQQPQLASKIGLEAVLSQLEANLRQLEANLRQLEASLRPLKAHSRKFEKC